MLSLVWIELSQSKTDWIIVDIPRNVLILGWARFKLITVINYLVPPDVERSERDVVGAGEVEELVVAGEGLEEVVGELEDGVGDDVVDDVLLVRVRVGVGHAHGVWGKVTSSGLCILYIKRSIQRGAKKWPYIWLLYCCCLPLLTCLKNSQNLGTTF